MEPKITYQNYWKGKPEEKTLEQLYYKVVQDCVSSHSGALEKVEDKFDKQNRITCNLLTVLLKKTLLTPEELGEILGVNVISIKLREE